MSAININSLTENASRFGMRLQESLSEHTRDLTLARGSGSGFFDAPEDKLKNIRQQLESNSDREKLDAMKRLIAMISKGRNVSEFFAQVVKNVASNNLEIRKLVYIYLLRYAEEEPDLALLSINTFQKDLTDPSPLIRAMALRVLSGIKVPMIGNIVVLAIKKCAADISPYVRKAASLAIPKCYSLDPNHQPALISIITTLLRDRSPLSIGTVAVAFEATCPTRLDLLHQHYRRLCRLLVDVDEWGQVAWLNLLNRYARTMLPRPYLIMNDRQESEENVDTDLQLLLTCSEALFQSRNPAVVLAVTQTFFYVGPPSQITKTVQPLLRLLKTSIEVERIVLAYLLVISRTHPTLVSPHFSRFLIRASDIRPTKVSKLQLLMSVISFENYQALLREFIQYADDPDDTLVEAAIGAIGYCARMVPDCTPQALTALMAFIQSKHDIVVTNSVLVLKSLVQTQLIQPPSPIPLPQSQSPLSIISRLGYMIDEIRHPKAKACAIWMVGQYSASNPPWNGVGIEGITEWAPDVLRRTVKTFCGEPTGVKLQVITLASKLLVLNPTDRTLRLLSRHVFSLARYDLNYDVRDRARLLSTLLAGVADNLLTDSGDDTREEQGGVILRKEQVKMVLFDGKAGVVESDFHGDYENATLGSLSTITGKDMSLEINLPDWLEEGTESSLRDSEDDAPQIPAYTQGTAPRAISSSSHMASPIILTPASGRSPAGSAPYGGSKGKWTDLDKFYADDDEGEEEEETESEEDEEASSVGDAEETESEEDASDSDEQRQTEGEHESNHFV